MGFSISGTILEAHGGQIWRKSNAAAGGTSEFARHRPLKLSVKGYVIYVTA
jgi:signal transduction histidine kinase